MKKSSLRVWMPVAFVALLAAVATIAALGQSSSAAVSVAQYQYGPTITLGTTIGPPRTSVNVAGSGFAASETIDLSVDSVNVSSTSADSTGTFSGTLKIPTYATPGRHDIGAQGRTSGLFGSASFLVRSDWPMFRYNAQHSATNQGENVLNPANVVDLQAAWTGATAGSIGTGPAIVGGIVYVAADSKLYAFGASDHVLKWSMPINGSGAQSSPAVANGAVYVGSSDGKLYSFNAATGVLLWSTATPVGPIASSPIVLGNSLYVGSNDGRLYAFNASTGAPRWNVLTLGAISSSPAVVGSVLYVGSGDTKLYAINLLNHSVDWIGSTGGAITSSPAIAKKVVYVGSNDGKLYAFDATTSHALLWSVTTGSAVQSSPA